MTDIAEEFSMIKYASSVQRQSALMDEIERLRAALAQQAEQPAPAAVPPGFDVHDLSDVADGLDVYERTIDVDGNHIESTTAYAARFIRAVLAVAGEKP